MAKSKKIKTTVNVDAVRKEAKKLAKQVVNQEAPNRTHAELAPGSVNRQSPLEQEMGSKKYKEMIHNHNDKNKHILDRLPFTFPRKKIVRSHRSDVVVECVNCGHQSYGSEYTCVKECPGCKKVAKVFNPEAGKRGEDIDFVPGFLATSSDILKMKEEQSEKKLKEIINKLNQ